MAPVNIFFYVTITIKPESVLFFLELLRAIESLPFPRKNTIKIQFYSYHDKHSTQCQVKLV